jgi:hypothetical protein
MSVAEAVESILAHHGVKGMRWGIRRKATVGPREVIVSDKRRRLRTSGGQGHPASSDAVRAQVIGQKAKKSGIKSLSNDELTTYSKRLNLEQNVKRLQTGQQSEAKKFVAGLLKQVGNQQANNVANNVVSKQIKKRLDQKDEESESE